MAHYLTVTVSDKYYCNVYTIENKVVDQVTHQIFVDNGTISLKVVLYHFKHCFTIENDPLYHLLQLTVMLKNVSARN